MALIRKKNNPFLTSEHQEEGRLILKNPRSCRSLVFKAVKETFPEETKNRVTHYTEKGVTRLTIKEQTRRYKNTIEPYEIDFNITKYGHKYVLAGMVKRTDIGDKQDIEAFVKTIPNRNIEHKPLCEARFTAAIRNINTRIDKIEQDIKRISQYVEPLTERTDVDEINPWNCRQSQAPHIQQDVPQTEVGEAFSYQM